MPPPEPSPRPDATVGHPDLRRDRDPELPPPSLEAIGARVVDLAQDLLSGVCESEADLFHYFQAFAYHVDDHGPDLDAARIARMLRAEIATLAAIDHAADDTGDTDDTGDQNWQMPPSRWKPDTPEESHVLNRLLANRIQAPGAEDIGWDDMHYDARARTPGAEKLLDALDAKLHLMEDGAAQLELLEKYIPQFREVADLYREVARKHGLETVRTRDDWISGKDVEELVAATLTPVDLSAAVQSYAASYRLKVLVWDAQAGGDAALRARLQAFFTAVPDIWFPEVRADFDELEGLAEDRAAFEAWILARAAEGIFRAEVMAEIERRWAGRELAAQAGRTVLQSLEDRRLLRRKKKEGRLFFIRPE